MPGDATRVCNPPTVLIPQPTQFIVLSTNNTSKWSVLDGAILETSVVKPWQDTTVVIQRNKSFQEEDTCYSPKRSVTITLWTNTVEKDMLVYQWLLYAYGLTKFTDTDSYKPSNWLKRYEAAKMFVEFGRNILCRQKSAIYTNQYTDIDDTDPTLKPYIIEALNSESWNEQIEDLDLRILLQIKNSLLSWWECSQIRI